MGAVDSLAHRLEGLCPGAPKPTEAIKKQFLRQPLKAPEELALRRRGFATEPSPVKPPTDDTSLVHIYLRGREGETISTAELDFFGVWIFTDGSCSKHELASRLNRAGWAIVQIDPETGELLAALAGPVLRKWQQTSPASEVTAACMAACFARAGVECRAYTDWQGITRLWGPAASLSRRQLWAGPVRAARGLHSIQFEWTRSHRDELQEAHGSHEWITAIGNTYADEWAAEGRKLHPQQDAGIVEEAMEQAALHRDFLLHAGRALAHWAREDREQVMWRRPVGARRRGGRNSPRLTRPHEWTTDAAQSVQRCIRCLAAQSAQSEARACHGGHFLEKLIANPMGHEIVVFRAPGCLPLVACSRCGASAESVPRGLSKLCSGILRPGQRLRLDRLLSEGRHPKEERLDQQVRYEKVAAHLALAGDAVVLDEVEAIPRRLFRARRRRRC